MKRHRALDRLRFSGLLCAGLLAADAHAADESSPAAICILGAGLPRFPTSGEYAPPPSAPGPVTYDDAHPVMARTVNQFGAVQENPMRLADLSNPNLKPWVVESLEKSQ